jgi:hypothetical protein
MSKFYIFEGAKQLPCTTRKILNTDGQNLYLKCKYFVTKHVRCGFDAVGNFLISELLETGKIYL